ncbi:MAG: hypothetical protein AAFX53_06200 [Bacteroidota bacterium]
MKKSLHNPQLHHWTAALGRVSDLKAKMEVGTGSPRPFSMSWILRLKSTGKFKAYAPS